jgi:hypothetical protein
MPLTKGFVNKTQRARHFAEHGGDFGASNAEEYEVYADQFLGAAITAQVHECTRQKGDKLRYNPTTQDYGVLDSRGIIRTCYRPIPCGAVPAAARSAMRVSGKCHPYANNFLYFQAECKRRW